MKNTPVVTAVIAGIVGIVAFFGGSAIQKNKDSLSGISSQDLPAKLAALGLNRSAGNPSRGGIRRGSPISGQVLTLDVGSITVKLQDGSNKIVYTSASTTVTSSIPATVNDISVGKQIVGTGTTASDGSITAATIQIKP